MPLTVPGRIAELLRRSTVQIKTIRSSHAGHGSGVVLHGGKIVTNAHVVGSSARVKVETWEGNELEGTVARIDSRRDLALIAAPGDGIPPLVLGDSDLLRSGTPVIAIGHPFGFIGAASSGVVHQRQGQWISADVHLAPGNSGGPLGKLPRRGYRH